MTFGEMGVEYSIANIKENLQNVVNASMLLGYAQKHTGVTNHMLNICTKCILLSRDIIRLNKTNGEYETRK